MTYKSAFPRTIRQLRSWLKHTEDGQRFLDRLTKEALEKRCRQWQREHQPRPKVLIVLRRLGRYPGVEVYAEREVSILFHELVETENNPKLEILADEMLALQVPRSWRHLLPDYRFHDVSLYQPVRGEVFRGLTIEYTLEALEELRTLRDLKAWRSAL